MKVSEIVSRRELHASPIASEKALPQLMLGSHAAAPSCSSNFTVSERSE
jgi:hypothetical protein